MKAFLCLAIAGLAVASSVHSAESRYTILLDNGARVAGSEVQQALPNGATKIRYVFKDNGRGPEFEEEFRVAADGTLIDYQIKGRTTFGSVIDERFTRRGATAQWRSQSDRGSVQVTGAALYVPLASNSIGIVSVLLDALTKSGSQLALLPAGEVRLRELESLELKQGTETKRVQLVALTGLGLTPLFVWVEPGASAVSAKTAFALINVGYSTEIRDGWQSHAQQLIERQQAAEAAQLREMAATLRHPMKGVTVIRNAKIFDSERAQLGALSDVYVLRGRITAVLPAGSVAEDVQNEIDAAGRVMLPGLFDMHVHASRWDGGLHLAAGVTSIRDMGNDNGTLQQIIDDTAAGTLLHAQVIPAGFLEGDGENAASQGFHVRDLPAAKKAIDWYAEHGYPHLKIYNSFPKDILRDTIAYAHSRGMRVGGHIPVFMRAEEAVEQGYDEIQHINQVLLNFLVTPTTDTRTLDRFYLPAEKVADLDFDSKRVQDFIALLKSRKTVIDPTIATFEFIAQRDGEVLPPYAGFIDHMPPAIQRGSRMAQMKIPDAKTAARYKKSLDKMTEFIGRLYKAGIPLVAGTDELPGFVLHSELEGYVRAGLTPSQALQVATWNGALYSKTLADRGSITPGKRADLVLIDGDPTTRISDLRKVALVITQDSWLSPVEVHQRLGVKPFVQSIPAVQTVKH